MRIPQIYYYALVLLTNRMNHTIKGIIIVIAITSMLVVGATMIPVIQNASARSTNTNSNTNTAGEAIISQVVKAGGFKHLDVLLRHHLT
jgi:hypothetical protein